MEPSIFTRIITGEIPCHKIYEDDKTIAFLDIHPVQPGHVLVVTKAQIVQFTDMDEPAFTNFMQVTHRLAKHIQATLQCHRVVLKFEGFDVPHVHAHLIPCNAENDSYRAGRDQEAPDHAKLAEIAAKLATSKDSL